MNKEKQLGILTTMMVIPFAVCAANGPWYVDKNDPNASDSNPGTEALPFKTIQGAMDNSARGWGDFVYVKPGYYDEGGAFAGGITNRVYSNKRVNLVATGGASRTFIVGAGDWAHDPVNGLGPAAVRCFMSEDTTETPSMITGFTFMGGATTDTVSGNWGAAAFNNNSKNGAATLRLVDCVISNCTATSYFARRATLVRCLISENRSLGGAGTRDCSMLDCVIVNNKGGTGIPPISGGMTCNCTIAENDPNGSDGGEHFNTIFSAISGADVWTGSPSFTACVRTSDDGGFHVASPLLHDFRLLTGSSAIGIGDANHRAKIVSDASLLAEDYLHGPVAETGTINAGAVQSVMQPAAAGLFFHSGAVRVSIDGRIPARIRSYVFPESWPTQYQVRIVSGEPFGIERFDGGGIGRFIWPATNDVFAVVAAPLSEGSVQTNVPFVAAETLWASPSGSDSNNGKSEQTPFLSVQKAVTSVASDNTVIRLLPGDYANGNSGLSRIRPNERRVFIRSVAGAGRTVIHGQRDASGTDPSLPGCGASVMRVINADGRKGAMQGVTLTDGCTQLAAGANGAACVGGDDFSLVDCVITGNSGYDNVCEKGHLIRCCVYGNSCAGTLVSGGFHSGTFVGSNSLTRSSSALVGDDAVLSSCTIAGAMTAGKAVASTVTAWNSVISHAGGHDLDLALASGVGNLAYGYDHVPESGVRTADPLLVNPSEGDFRPLVISPAVAAGEPPSAVNFASDCRWWTCAGIFPDVNRGFVVSPEGKFPAGAWQCDFPIGYRIVNDRGGLSLSGTTDGLHVVEAGRSVTFTIAKNSSAARNCLGFTVNGEFCSFVDWPQGRSFTVSDAGSSVSIVAVISTDWYVSPTGSDAADGFTRMTPFRTLAKAMSLAESGDTVWVLPGDYAEASEKAESAHSVFNRVVVKPGVTLRSTDGAAVTTIFGADAPSPDEHGCGEGATRCVWVRAGGVLKGVTLSGGRARYAGPTSMFGLDADYQGGGVYGESGALVEDCVVTNGKAYGGGGGVGAVFHRCRIVNCFADCYANALNGGAAVNCIFDQNLSAKNGGSVTYHTTPVLSCTFGTGNRTASGTAEQQPSALFAENSDAWTDYKFYDNLVLCSTHPQKELNGDNRYCVFAKKSDDIPGRSLGWEALGEGSVLVDRAEMDVDAACRPIPGVCGVAGIVTDKGSVDLYRSVVSGLSVRLGDEDVDVAGGARVSGGCLDVGAYEYDWRPRLATDVGLRGRSSIVAASPAVSESPARRVRIPDGAEVLVSWIAGKRGEMTLAAGVVRRFLAQVTGEGTLSVMLNGELFCTLERGAEPREFTFENNRTENFLRFVFVGEGYAELLRFTQDIGLVMIVR